MSSLSVNFLFYLLSLSFARAFRIGLMNEKGRFAKHIRMQEIEKTYEYPNCSEPICTGPLSKIYCTGKIIHMTWQFGLQNSCPGDMLVNSSQNIIDEFEKGDYSTREDFASFCYRNFQNFDYLLKAELNDWTIDPPKMRAISNPLLKKFALKLNDIWKDFGRKFHPMVALHPEKFPVFYVPHEFIVPGGFFKIYFYWDSYWIIKGLLFSDMLKTSMNIARNFASIIERIGYIPNSGNIQLSRRSQPPLFTQMVNDIFANSKDENFLLEMLPYIETELKWWRTNRTVFVEKDGRRFKMYQYKSVTNCPRPENYLVDLINGYDSTQNAEFIWSSIASACESGLDFSTRWFAHTGKSADKKFSIRTNHIIPVDLNVFMVMNYRTLSYFYTVFKKIREAKKYARMANNLQLAIEKMMYNETDGIWYDYDIEYNSGRFGFYPNCVFPLLLGGTSMEKADKILKYLHSTHILNFKGGIPSSLNMESKEQWDFPNGWAPHNHLFIESLKLSGDKELQKVAKIVADKFIMTVYNGLFNPLAGLPPVCWEKYDVRYDDGRPATSGEYPVQQGFGWTNGAILDLIKHYYSDSKTKMNFSQRKKSSSVGNLENLIKGSEILRRQHMKLKKSGFSTTSANNFI